MNVKNLAIDYIRYTFLLIKKKIVVDRSTALDCPTYTPLPPSLGSTMTTTTTMRPFMVNTASELHKIFVCKGSQKSIVIPSGYSLAIINSYYGTTPDYTCNTIKFVC